MRLKQPNPSIKTYKSNNLKELYNLNEVLAIIRLMTVNISNSNEHIEKKRLTAFREQLSTFIKNNW
jgi:hypothetical protein